MAEISSLPFIRHLRAEPTAHVLHYRRGALDLAVTRAPSHSRRPAARPRQKLDVIQTTETSAYAP